MSNVNHPNELIVSSKKYYILAVPLLLTQGECKRAVSFRVVYHDIIYIGLTLDNPVIHLYF